MKPLNDATIAGLTAHLEKEEEFVFLESSRVSKENHQSLLFTQPCSHLTCLPGDDVADFLDRADRLREQGYFLAGWLAYEFGYLLEPCLRCFLPGKNSRADRPLAVLGVYNEPLIYNHQSDSFSNGSGWPNSNCEQAAFDCAGLQPTLSRQQYLRAIKTIQEYIRAGDTYQVNFTLHLDFLFQGSVAALYQALRRNQSVSYGAWIRFEGQDILSFSPELFFAADPTRVRVRPMKGTMVRGRTGAEDKEQRMTLGSDPKNQSENVMIVDLLRNDLGRLLHAAGGGTVQPQSLFDVETYESLLQMTSTIDGIPAKKGSFSFKELMSALFPCGSITGAPKIRTMEIIHELEQQARGVYCGAIGYAGQEKSCFNVPIRTIELQNGQGRMGIGSGIIADSDPEAEWQESLLKGNFLTKIKPDFQLIETLLLQPDGEYFLLDFHLQRLVDSARYFCFSCDSEAIRCQLLEMSNNNNERQRVRLLLYRDGRVSVTSVQLAEDPSLSSLPKVVFSSQHVDENDPYFFHKTTRRQLFNKEHSRAVELGYFDVLFTNSLGQVTEGAICNLFVADKGRLLTPPISCGLLAGTYRRMLLEQGRAVEEILSIGDVLSAEEVYLANSVRGLIRVEVEER